MVNVQQLGDSLAVTIPKEIAEKLGITKGMSLSAGITLMGGEYAVYYQLDKNNGKG